MADQIPNEDKIWDLNPAELLIAYLSLTLNKAQIAEKEGIDDGTVGSHLTEIYRTLGLSDYPDDVKRSLLNATYGETLRSIVKEIDEKYAVDEQKTTDLEQKITAHKQKIKDLNKKRSDIRGEKKKVKTPPPQPKIDEHPPSPRPIPQPNRITNTGWIIIAIAVITTIISLLFLNRSGMFPVPQNETSTPTGAATYTPTLATSPTSTGTFTPLPPTPTPTLSPTATVSPTALPLPIIENFDRELSPAWRPFGNPLIQESVGTFGAGWSGILTARDGDSGKILIGNTAWHDYIVVLKAGLPFRGSYVRIGVRVLDLDNMIFLQCPRSGYPVGSFCSLVILSDGIEDRVPSDVAMDMVPLTITVQGNTIRAVSGLEGYNAYKPGVMSVILEPKYQTKFSGGGVLLEVGSVPEVDYIQIKPIP